MMSSKLTAAAAAALQINSLQSAAQVGAGEPAEIFRRHFPLLHDCIL
jgi:hypothetical protein